MKHKKHQNDQRNLLHAILAFAIGLVVVKYYKRQPKDKSAESSNVLDNLGINPSEMPMLIDVSQKVAQHMGTAYPKWDPRNWTENDKLVYENMLRISSQKHFEAVAQLYSTVDAKGNDLSTDLKKHLDSKYYSELIYK